MIFVILAMFLNSCVQAHGQAMKVDISTYGETPEGYVQDELYSLEFAPDGLIKDLRLYRFGSDGKEQYEVIRVQVERDGSTIKQRFERIGDNNKIVSSELTLWTEKRTGGLTEFHSNGGAKIVQRKNSGTGPVYDWSYKGELVLSFSLNRNNLWVDDKGFQSVSHFEFSDGSLSGIKLHNTNPPDGSWKVVSKEDRVLRFQSSPGPGGTDKMTVQLGVNYNRTKLQSYAPLNVVLCSVANPDIYLPFMTGLF